MNADLVVQPIDEIRAAVSTISEGLGRGGVFGAEQWDLAVKSVARCHDQLGGDTRRLVYAMFSSSAASDAFALADLLSRADDVRGSDGFAIWEAGTLEGRPVQRHQPPDESG